MRIDKVGQELEYSIYNPATALYKGRTMSRSLRLFLCLAVAFFPFGLASLMAQETPAPANPDGSIVEGPPPRPRTPAELKDQAWSMLTDAVTDGKKTELQAQALGALGIMGANTRSLSLIQNAMLSPDVDVRTAAALAAGQTKSPLVTTDLRKLLDDKEPQVVYTAALTLWKLHDRSGEDILMAVVDGDRGTSPKRMHGMKQDIHRELQNPAGIARFGALQGAGLLLGPFGFGITAYEYLHKNGGDSARVAAVEAISENHTDPIRKELLAALGDKDLGVRAASAKALARYPDAEVASAISNLFLDPKPPVRLTAAAAYLINTAVAPGSPKEGEKPDTPRARPR